MRLWDPWMGRDRVSRRSSGDVEGDGISLRIADTYLTP
jgi:hypothetical protein